MQNINIDNVSVVAEDLYINPTGSEDPVAI
jgi:hypothetical protein